MVLTSQPSHTLIARVDLGISELSILLTPFDLKRLEAYANNMLDYHVILDILPTVATLYFEKRLGEEVKLSAVQSSILLALGLQRKTIKEVETELSLPVSKALASFVKIIRKISKRLTDIQKAAIVADIPAPAEVQVETVEEASTDWKPVETSLYEELREAGNETTKALWEKQREVIDLLGLSRYAIGNDVSRDWTVTERQVAALEKEGSGSGKATVVSVKSTVAPSKAKKHADAEIKKHSRRGKKH